MRIGQTSLWHSWPARWSVTDCSDRRSRRARSHEGREPCRPVAGRQPRRPVGQNLADAAALVDAIVQRVEQRVSTVEHQAVSEVALATRADVDLSVAERLANELGSHVNQAAQLRSDLVARRDLAAITARAAELRSELERTDTDRRRLFERWAALDNRWAISAPLRRRSGSWHSDAARRSCRRQCWRFLPLKRLANSHRATNWRRCRGRPLTR